MRFSCISNHGQLEVESLFAKAAAIHPRQAEKFEHCPHVASQGVDTPFISVFVLRTTAIRGSSITLPSLHMSMGHGRALKSGSMTIILIPAPQAWSMVDESCVSRASILKSSVSNLLLSLSMSGRMLPSLHEVPRCEEVALPSCNNAPSLRTETRRALMLSQREAISASVCEMRVVATLTFTPLHIAKSIKASALVNASLRPLILL